MPPVSESGGRGDAGRYTVRKDKCCDAIVEVSRRKGAEDLDYVAAIVEVLYDQAVVKYGLESIPRIVQFYEEVDVDTMSRVMSIHRIIVPQYDGQDMHKLDHWLHYLFLHLRVDAEAVSFFHRAHSWFPPELREDAHRLASSLLETFAGL